MAISSAAERNEGTVPIFLLFALAACSPLGNAGYAVLLAVDGPGAVAWERAEISLTRCNWDEARRHLAECLRHCENNGMRQHVCKCLAWLEDDPELAVRYMEAASSGGDWVSLMFCVKLALASGSPELAQYYTERGRSGVPEFDRKLAGFTMAGWLAELRGESPAPFR